jgi:hypothetical protein
MPAFTVRRASMTTEEILRELEPLAWAFRCVWAPLRFAARHPTAVGLLIFAAMTVTFANAAMQNPPHELAPLGAQEEREAHR